MRVLTRGLWTVTVRQRSTSAVNTASRPASLWSFPTPPSWLAWRSGTMRVSYYFYVGIDSISIETIQGISLNWIHRFKIPLNFPLWPNWQSVSAIASSFVVVMPDMTKTIIDLGCILLPQIKPVTPPQWLQHSCLMYRNSHIHVGIFLSCDTDTNVICSTHFKWLLDWLKLCKLNRIALPIWY